MEACILRSFERRFLPSLSNPFLHSYLSHLFDHLGTYGSVDPLFILHSSSIHPLLILLYSSSSIHPPFILHIREERGEWRLWRIGREERGEWSGWESGDYGSDALREIKSEERGPVKGAESERRCDELREIKSEERGASGGFKRGWREEEGGG
jgi:hypothetical protein